MVTMRSPRAFVCLALALAAIGYLGTSQSAYASDVTGVHVPAVSGAIPLFDKPKSTPHGFTVNVTNYSEEYVWSAKTDLGKVEKGEANGTTLPITVTGLQSGESATVEVTAEMPGLEPSTAIVTGTALTSTVDQTQKGSATERFAFAGPSSRINSEGNLLLQRLVARVPTGATPTRVTIAVAEPPKASTSQHALALARANAISRYLLSRHVKPVATITTPQSKRPGMATVRISYLH